MKTRHIDIKFCIVMATIFAVLFSVNVSAEEVKGTVKFKGEPRKAKPVKMVGDDHCATVHETPPVDEKFVFGETDEKGIVTMANVFVWVKKGLPEKTYDVPKEPAVVDQKGCMFVPHVLGIRAGQELEIRNSDKTAHNVHALPMKNKQFNNGQPPDTRPMTKIFEREEVMVQIKCDIHKWMGCFVGVVSHPFFAVTGKDGTFSLKDLPAGEYQIEAWHELLKTASQTVRVEAGKAANVEFTFSKP